MKKYELTTNTKMVLGRKLFQIRALISFGDVKCGALGGWIEKEENLSQYGDAWVSGNAQVSGNAWVSGNARVDGNNDYITIGPIGSRSATTTFYRRSDGVTMVVCGCFHSTINEFEQRVNDVHADNKHGQAYRAAIALARIQMNSELVEE